MVMEPTKKIIDGKEYRIHTLTEKAEYLALYRRMREEKLLRPYFLCYDTESIWDEDWWVSYLGADYREIYAGFIDDDFAGALFIQPFHNMYSNTAEIGMFATRYWMKKKEQIRTLYRLSIKRCFDEHKCDAVVGVVPEPNRHCRICSEYFGMRKLGSIPGMCYWAEKDKYVSGTLYINTLDDVEK